MRTAIGLITLLSASLAAPAQQPKEKEKGALNGLAHETSPYLLQHARNPVDWQPWGREALQKAKDSKKLIFLSIGYSSCHWCHVMERESFSNPAIAKVLNDNFVCIKVDREERPEVDEVYMTALQVMDLRGGWPMSLFLTPEGKPIVGGTYWPPEDRTVEGYEVAGFKTFLNKLIALKATRGDELAAQADEYARVTAAQFALNSRKDILATLDPAIVDDALPFYKDGFDSQYGGVGYRERKFAGPKFPMAPTWSFLLKYGRERKNADAAGMAHFTLKQMAQGGIYDQLAGGFHRYSTERTWSVPHFEKMLYDNAQLVELYSVAYKDKPEDLYKKVVAETIAFVLRDMTSPEGLFYTAWDADSEGQEGKSYVWTERQIEVAVPDRANAALIKARFGVTGRPNFEDDRYVLRAAADWLELAKRFPMPEKALQAKVAETAAQMLAARDRRPQPFRDEKAITGWNGQMIAALATAGQAFDRKDWIAAAEKAARLLEAKAVDEKGRLQRIIAKNAEGKSVPKINACLDDYAYLVHGLLNLHEATGAAEWKAEAGRLIDEAVKLLVDPNAGGFFMTAGEDEILFTRVKDYTDNVQPAANNVMVDNLLRYSILTKDVKYAEVAEKSLKQFVGRVKNSPTSAPVLLGALMDYLKK